MRSENSDENREWGMVQSFHIDNGELQGLRLEDVFVLGVEFQMFFHSATHLDDAFSLQMHPENEARVCAMLRKHGRDFRVRYMPGDVSESWKMVDVAAKGGA